MRRALGPFLTALLAALAFAAPANARPAECLFEIDDAHDIGSVCEFTHRDLPPCQCIVRSRGR